MTEKKDKIKKEEKLKMQGQEEWPLPYCNTAADPEHQRAHQEDEPCDDARGTVFQEQGKNVQDQNN
ncbi:MAG: hypothetical protein JW932_14170 [Deltaproteobacteria bacterium]|nr:hypothetical protein [Deltaproteobacteria bacterium]